MCYTVYLELNLVLHIINKLIIKMRNILNKDHYLINNDLQTALQKSNISLSLSDRVGIYLIKPKHS